MSQRSFVCTQLNGFKYSKRWNNSVWHVDVTLIGMTSLDQSEPGVMPMKENSTFLKAPGLESHHQMQFSVIYMTLVVREVRSYLSAEMKFVYSTAPVN